MKVFLLGRELIRSKKGPFRQYNFILIVDFFPIILTPLVISRK